jgi:hypothetical protein
MRPPASRRLPWGLLAAVGLTVATELVVARHRAELSSSIAYSWSETGRAVSSVALGSDVLGFGDSRVKFGVVPAVIEAKTGTRAYNLALLSGSAPSSFVLLRRALAAGARPKAVVVDYGRVILGDGPSSTVRPYPWADLLTVAETLELAVTARDADLLAAVVARKLVPSLRARFEIREAVVSALGGTPSERGEVNRAQRRNWAVNRGAQLVARVANSSDEGVRPGEPPGTGGWQPDPVNAAYVERFLALARSKGVAVYWLIPPAAPGLQARWNHSGDEAAYDHFAASFLRRFEGLTLVDARAAGFDAAQFVDGVHLDREGALALSSALAEVIGGDHHERLVRLAGPLPAPPVVAVEDVGTSRAAVRAGHLLR